MEIKEVYPARRRYRLSEKEKSMKGYYPHISIVFKSEKELKEFDKAIKEERLATKMPGLNRSKIIRKLVRKWIDYEVSI